MTDNDGNTVGMRLGMMLGLTLVFVGMACLCVATGAFYFAASPSNATTQVRPGFSLALPRH